MNYPCCKHCMHDTPKRSLDGHSTPCMMERCPQGHGTPGVWMRLASRLNLLPARI